MRILVALFILSFVACKQEEVDVDGLYIDHIAQNKIHFKNGKTLTLDMSDGAKVIYLVRHAEKDTVPNRKNPILTEAGYERSYKLANIFKKSRLDAIYSTFFTRTMHTVDSLSTMKGLPTNIYQPEDMKIEVEEILANPSENNIIISGHSNTTPAMASVFMGKTLFDKGFDESDYDNMLVVNIKSDGTKKLYQLRYN